LLENCLRLPTLFFPRKIMPALFYFGTEEPRGTLKNPFGTLKSSMNPVDYKGNKEPCGTDLQKVTCGSRKNL
jgi:hypothetical protein